MNAVNSLPPLIRTYAGIVLANYAAQVVYAVDLYGWHVNVAGAGLLALTFVWFLAGLAAYAGGRRYGAAVLAAYTLAQFAFYFVVEVVLAFTGSGMPYQLTHAHDAVVWLVFLIGDVSFLASGIALVYLLARRRAAVEPGPAR